jgi:hypothetical protein
VRLESRGLQSYLVETEEGYFLFSENLRQGRLVSRDLERAMKNLQASPVNFDDPLVLQPAGTTLGSLDNSILAVDVSSSEMDMT